MSYTETLPKVQELVNNLLVVLSEKERFIIENRFSLNENPKLTLENIGKKYSVTRERVRQIEKNALRKLERNVANTALIHVTVLAHQIIKESGGLTEEDNLIAEILKRSDNAHLIDVNSLKLTVDLEKDIVHVHNTIQYRPYWKMTATSSENIRKVCEAAYKALNGTNEVVPGKVLAETIIKKLELNLSIEFVVSSFYLDRRLKVLKNGDVGLTTWRTINPKTLRDKIYYAFKKLKEPMHYVEISEAITKMKLGGKTVNVQAVHNELIRHSGFILIGRGIYALSEWGYKEGTVADVIIDILKKHGELKRDEIVAKVLEKRKVKKITIHLNLKNRKEFERTGKDVYKLAQ